MIVAVVHNNHNAPSTTIAMTIPTFRLLTAVLVIPPPPPLVLLSPPPLIRRRSFHVVAVMMMMTIRPFPRLGPPPHTPSVRWTIGITTPPHPPKKTTTTTISSRYPIVPTIIIIIIQHHGPWNKPCINCERSFNSITTTIRWIPRNDGPFKRRRIMTRQHVRICTAKDTRICMCWEPPTESIQMCQCSILHLPMYSLRY